VASKAASKTKPTAKAAAPVKKAAAKAKAPAKVAPPPKPKLPTKVVKPKRATAPSIPLPPPPPPPPPTRDELVAPRDIGRLLRYGEKFGALKIDIRWQPTPLPLAGTSIGLGDPAAPKSWRELDRPVPPGTSPRVMLSYALDAAAGKEELAAAIFHVGRPPIAKWTVAHFKGQKKPKSPDALPGVEVSGPTIRIGDAASGLDLPSGKGTFTSYWAVDAADKPVCLVVDFDVLTQKEWKAKAT